MPSASLRVNLKTAALLQDKGGGFTLCYGNEHIVAMAEISGFLEIINYFSSMEEAVNAIVD
jgi:anti-anti-sigma regulatory factor